MIVHLLEVVDGNGYALTAGTIALFAAGDNGGHFLVAVGSGAGASDDVACCEAAFLPIRNDGEIAGDNEGGVSGIECGWHFASAGGRRRRSRGTASSGRLSRSSLLGCKLRFYFVGDGLLHFRRQCDRGRSGGRLISATLIGRRGIASTASGCGIRFGLSGVG